MNPYVFPGFSIHDELAYFVESGVTPLGSAAGGNPQSGTLHECKAKSMAQ